MRRISFHNHDFSQFILGTVQLGIKYGISNTSGQPSLSQSVEMIKLATKLGVNTFDTARAYGTAEAVIAKAESQFTQQKTNHIMTKFRVDPAHETDLEKSWQDVLASIGKSLRALRREKVCAALFHRSPGNDMNAVRKILFKIIARLKEMNLIEMGGLSAHYPDDVMYAVDEGQLEIIQVPCNLFDHRLMHVVSPQALANKLVIARSIFLQGLFFLDPNHLKKRIRMASRHLIRLQEICSKYKLTISQLAVIFVRDLPQVDCIVVGAITPNQIIENINLIRQPGLENTIRNEIIEAFSDVEDFIMTPALWST